MTEYWLDLFTAGTWEETRECGFKVTGFRESRWPIVSKIKTGDLFVCYITKLSRFSGILKAISTPYRTRRKQSKLGNVIFPYLIDVF